MERGERGLRNVADPLCQPGRRLARGSGVWSWAYHVTPPSGLTLGPVISSKLNWEATWNNAFPFAGSRCIVRTSPEIQETFTLPTRLPKTIWARSRSSLRESVFRFLGGLRPPERSTGRLHSKAFAGSCIRFRFICSLLFSVAVTSLRTYHGVVGKAIDLGTKISIISRPLGLNLGNANNQV